MGIAGQIVLPCCWPQQPPPQQAWIGLEYPMTVDEMALVERGIRIARFVDDTECCHHCQFGPYDHTVGRTYPTKVCLKDLARLGLWAPPKSEDTFHTRHFDERSYRIQHRPSGLFADVQADSAEEAVRISGAAWRMEDCWVRQYTSKGGWGKVRV